jgi:hypothetical protein
MHTSSRPTVTSRSYPTIISTNTLMLNGRARTNGPAATLGSQQQGRLLGAGGQEGQHLQVPWQSLHTHLTTPLVIRQLPQHLRPPLVAAMVYGRRSSRGSCSRHPQLQALEMASCTKGGHSKACRAATRRVHTIIINARL